MIFQVSTFYTTSLNHLMEHICMQLTKKNLPPSKQGEFLVSCQDLLPVEQKGFRRLILGPCVFTIWQDQLKRDELKISVLPSTGLFFIFLRLFYLENLWLGDPKIKS